MATPQRRCVGCAARVDKTQLQRFVLVDGTLTPDAEQRLAGRGAYACDAACAQRAAARGGFARSFRRSVAVEPDLLHSI
ncbi:MAG: YlxR family protein [Solirubrobacteraceae bacterium]|nr:YlxR family protein [Solirubrobacteraceae bacterium]